jgi:hypothetical protein
MRPSYFLLVLKCLEIDDHCSVDAAVGPRAKSLDSSLMSAITGETDSLAKILDRCALTLKRHQRLGNWTEMYAA